MLFMNIAEKAKCTIHCFGSRTVLFHFNQKQKQMHIIVEILPAEFPVINK